MRFANLSTWLLSAAALAASTDVVSDDYVPRPLNDTVKDLGLEEYVENMPPLNKRDTSTRCSVACGTLAAILSKEVERPGTDAYTENKASYWAQQQSALSPTCFIAAQRPLSIQIAITISRVTQCPFAIRGGGHSDVPGASNIDNDGITIDLRALNAISISSDKKTVAVGSGAKWIDLYNYLDPLNLTAVGGRAASVGVGDLTLGGGMSWISGKGGFACDNVRNYKVLLADGIILDVNYQSFPDLYWALRGGGSNFGIVLQYDIETIEVGEMWGGMRLYPIVAEPVISAGVASFNEHASDDPDLAVISSFMYRQGMYLATAIFDYAKPVVEPQIFKDHFSGLSQFPTIMDTTRLTNMSDLAVELGGGTPNGFRNQFTTATYKNSAEIQSKMVGFFKEEVESALAAASDPDGISPVIAFQTIPTSISKFFSKNGGNALGISPEDGPLILVQFNWAWSSADDDEVVLGAINNILTRSNAAAEEMGLSYPYLYMNYAAPFQKPVASYGAENVNKLRQVQAKYDCLKVFERLMPGGFKLDD